MAVTRVNLSAPPANDSEQTTRDISGPSSQLELLPCDQLSASSRTSKGTFLWDSSKSYETFKDLVIAARSEYSARLKLARRISESGSSSWPTIRASEYKDTGPVGSKSHSHMLAKGYLCAVVTAGPADQDSRSSLGSRRELWPTATAVNRVRGEETLAKCAAFRKRNANQNTVPLYLEEKVKIEEAKQWATPRSCSAMAATITPEVAHDAKRFPNLETQVGKQQWATPRVHEHMEPPEKWMARNLKKKAENPKLGTLDKPLGTMVAENQGTCGKLNPRWVETLMGLPVGWTMPSCASPVTPEWTSSDCSATASCQQQPSEPLTS